MAKRAKNKGLPKALTAEQLDQEEPNPFEPTLEEFIQDLHGDLSQPQDGMPSERWLKEHFSTTSARIRFLVNQGFEVKRIAKHLGIRYQQARNVAKTPLKRGPNEDWTKPYKAGETSDPKQSEPSND